MKTLFKSGVKVGLALTLGVWDEQPKDSDDYLLNQGYATITPHRIDQTDEESLEVISEMLAETPVNN